MGQIERVRQSLGDNRLVWWFVYGGNRLGVMAGLWGAAVVVYFILGALNIIFLPGNRLMWLLNGLVNGLLSLVTIVLTVNQLVLSQQFGSMGELYTRFEEMIDFRKQVEGNTAVGATPVESGEFIAVLLAALSDRAQELKEGASACDNEELVDEIDEYTTDLSEQANSILDEVEDAEGTFGVLLTILDYNNSRQFYTSRRLQTVYADAHSDATGTALSEIRELLKEITPRVSISRRCISSANSHNSRA